MPRVSSKTKNKAGDAYRCDQCAEPIKAGDKYYEWSFRYGGTHRQHATHGSPKPSQLTQSKMSGAYAAIESAEAEIAQAETVDDLKAALENCASEIENVAQEYQDSYDAIPENLQQGGTAQEMQEKIEALQSFAEELNGTDLDEFEEDEPEEDTEESTDHADWETRRDDHFEEQRSAAKEALGQLSI